MAIRNYFFGRSHDDPLRQSARFWYAAGQRLKGVSADRAGSRLYLGFELEVDSFRTHSEAVEASDVVDNVLGEYGFVCKSDGSLSHDSRDNVTGFEIVSDPMTLGALMLIRPKIEAVLAELDRRGGKSHNSPRCGLHVHSSRAAYGNDNDAKFLAFGKLMELTEHFQAEFSSIARRDLACTNWCKPTGYGHSLTDGSRAVRRKAKAVLSRQHAYYPGTDTFVSTHDDQRYHVWNFQNKPTVECRAFKGTLKAETLFATFAFIDGLVRFCTLKTTPEVHDVTFADLIAWIGNADLTAYWADRASQTSRYTPYAA